MAQVQLDVISIAQSASYGDIQYIVPIVLEELLPLQLTTPLSDTGVSDLSPKPLVPGTDGAGACPS